MPKKHDVIGIIGFGYVGKATANGFKNFKPKIFDIIGSSNSFDEVVEKSDIIFLCLPTPMTSAEDGEIDLITINETIKKISQAKGKPKNQIIVLRSTVTPGTTRGYQKKYSDLNLVFNPEFLTQKNFIKDFLRSDRIILGGKNNKDKSLTKVRKIYRQIFPQTPIFLTTFETAEFTKYLSNNFLATKVAFFNEQYILAKTNKEIDWRESMKILVMDSRIGHSHTNVPGPDKQMGFGGKCLPKDICAFRSWAKKNGVNPEILNAAWQFNKKIRTKWDWAEIDGAVNKPTKRSKSLKPTNPKRP